MISTKDAATFLIRMRKKIIKCFQQFFSPIYDLQGIRSDKKNCTKRFYIAFFSHFYAKHIQMRATFSICKRSTSAIRFRLCRFEMWIIVVRHSFIHMHTVYLFRMQMNGYKCIQIKRMTALCIARKYHVLCLHSKLDAVDFII